MRKEAKTYGTAKLAEGPDISGRRLTLIEDVITTGGQVILSTEELRWRGAEVGTVVCVVDRRPTGGRAPDKLAEAGLSMRPLFTLDENPRDQPARSGLDGRDRRAPGRDDDRGGGFTGTTPTAPKVSAAVVSFVRKTNKSRTKHLRRVDKWTRRR